MNEFHPHRRRVLIAGLLLPGVLAATGCDSDATTSAVAPSPSASATVTDTATSVPAGEPSTMPDATMPDAVMPVDVEPFCDAVAEFDGTPSPGGPTEPTADDMRAFADTVEPIVGTMAAHAPVGAADAVETLELALGRAADGDVTVGEDPALAAALEDIEQAVRDHCDVATVDVTGVDFRFEMPSTVPAGPISFRLVNQGSQFHVFLVLKAPPDVTDDVAFLDRFLAAADSGDPAAFEEFAPYDVPGNPPVAEPGGTGTVIKVLEPGEYIYFCPIPVDFADPASGTHFHAGMHGRFTVEA